MPDDRDEPPPLMNAQEVRPPSPTEQDPPLAPEGADEHWRENLDAGKDSGPTSAHEEEGWRSLKLF